MDSKSPRSVQPIVIKKKRVVKGDGHHGGAWKVAYADFVTAMMAFFLLMWLLNATTEDQRKGIADYFNPSIPVSRISGGGSDGLNGSSIFTQDTLARMGTGAEERQAGAATEQKEETDSKSSAGGAMAEQGALSNSELSERFETLKDKLKKDPRKLSEHVIVKVSPEGLVLEIIDSQSAPLFELGSNEPTDVLVSIVEVLAGSFNEFQNPLKIVGHTDSRPFRDGERYDNWDLSSERAHTARRLLTREGFDDGRIHEVSGRAERDPLLPDDPTAVQNRRISLVILTP